MSFPVYPAYKKSDVEWLGEVPEHWILTSLKHLALLNPRKSGYDGDTEQLCSFVPMEKLKTGVVQLDEERPIEEVIGGYTYFEDGDVLQAKVTPCFENKNVAIAKGLTNGIGFGSSEINVLRAYQGVNAEYLYYRVQEGRYMDFCTSSMIGAGGLKRVPTDVINNFKVATPEIFEQIQIARFLNHETARIDALIEEQQRLIELLKEKRQAVISHAVTKGLDPRAPMKNSGVEWLGEVPAHWEQIRIKHILSAMIDAEHKTAEYTDEGEYLVCRTTNVRNGRLSLNGAKYADESTYLDWTRRGKPEPLDILFTREAPAGEACMVPERPEICLGQRMVLFKLNKTRIDPAFTVYSIYAGLASDFIMKLSQGSTVGHFNMADIGNIPLFEPPLYEQKEISNFLDKRCDAYDSLIQEAELSVRLITERRSALISAAVTGKIDVRGWQPPTSAPSPASAQEAV